LQKQGKQSTKINKMSIRLNSNIVKILALFKRRIVKERIYCNVVVFKSDGLYFQVNQKGGEVCVDIDPNTKDGVMGWVYVPYELEVEQPFVISYFALAGLKKTSTDIILEPLPIENGKEKMSFSFVDDGKTQSSIIEIGRLKSDEIRNPPIKPTEWVESDNFFSAVNQCKFATDDDATMSLSGVTLKGADMAATDGRILMVRKNIDQPQMDKYFSIPYQFMIMFPSAGKCKITKDELHLIVDFNYENIPITLYTKPHWGRFPKWEKLIEPDDSIPADKQAVPLCEISKNDVDMLHKYINKLPAVALDWKNDRFEYILITTDNGRLCFESISDKKENTKLICSADTTVHSTFIKQGYVLAIRFDAIKGYLATHEKIKIETRIEKENIDKPEKYSEFLFLTTDSYIGAAIAFSVMPRTKTSNFDIEAQETLMYHLKTVQPITDTIDLSTSQSKQDKTTKLTSSLFS
jgi:hypothetical protein